jgi:hypothetical protein
MVEQLHIVGTSGAMLNQTLEETKVLVRNLCVRQLNDGFDIKQWWNDYCYDGMP